MNLTAADLVNISLALEDREIILRNSKGHHSANHLRFLRERLDRWMAENDIPHEGTAGRGGVQCLPW
jgi:hypothetical protein